MSPIIDFIHNLSGTLTTLRKDGTITRGGEAVDTSKLPGRVTKLGIDGSRLVVLVSGELYEAVPKRLGTYPLAPQTWTKLEAGYDAR